MVKKFEQVSKNLILRRKNIYHDIIYYDMQKINMWQYSRNRGVI